MAHIAHLTTTIVLNFAPIILLIAGVHNDTFYYAPAAMGLTILAAIISSKWGLKDKYTTLIQFVVRVIAWAFSILPPFPSTIPYPYTILNAHPMSSLALLIITTEPIFYIIMTNSGTNMGVYGVFMDFLGVLMGLLVKSLEILSEIPLAVAMVIQRLCPIGEPAGEETAEASSNAPVPPDVSHDVPASHNAPPPYQATAEINSLIRSKAESFNSQLV
ncbi:hypothetical protein FIBSPDRAFT_1044370 [Athelia psychrophila]|uniref:Uncharacterized protein n=1 Tax=Athelia psychrophila TaxID=1759441 RepID=A0A166JTX1_9AGAM|nr:hypothetical protein FIBSPDRAFT_1044370 [Fibularhizoctonia sp. CBS 109695]